MGINRDILPVCKKWTSSEEVKEGLRIPTALRGFAASTRGAVTALRLMFGSKDFYYRQAVEDCHITPKDFAKMRSDGIVVKIGKYWPVRWKLAQRYLGTTQ